MRCNKCQVELADDTKYCAQCGTAISSLNMPEETMTGVSQSGEVIQKRTLWLVIAIPVLLLLPILGFLGWRIFAPNDIPVPYKVGDDIQTVDLSTRQGYSLSRVKEVQKDKEQTILHFEPVDAPFSMRDNPNIPTLKFGNGIVLANFLLGMGVDATDSFIPIVVYPGKRVEKQPYNFEVTGLRLNVTASSEWEKTVEASGRCIKTTLVLKYVSGLNSGESPERESIIIETYYSLQKGFVKASGIGIGYNSKNITVHYFSPPISDLETYAHRFGIQRAITPAERSAATSRIKELAYAVIEYAEKHNGQFPTLAAFNALTVDKARQVSPITDKPFTYNEQLAGKTWDDIRNPTETVVLFDEEADGKRCVAFADGHANHVSREEWHKLMP